MATFQLSGGGEQLERLGRLYEEQRLCDLVLQAAEGTQTEKFNVPRVFLATTSDYWDRLLAQEGFVESGEQVVRLGVLAPNTMALLLRCAYGLKVTLGPEDTVRVINAADRFGMARLQADLVRHFHTLSPTPSTHPDFFLAAMAALAPDPPPSPSSSPQPRKRARGETGETQNPPPSTTVPLACVSDEVATYCKHTFMRNAVEFLSGERVGQVGVGVVEAVLQWRYHTCREAELLDLAVRWATATGRPLGWLAWHVRYPLMSSEELAGVEEAGHVPADVLLQAYKAVALGRDYAAERTRTWPKDWLVPRLGHTVVLHKEAQLKNPGYAAGAYRYGGTIDLTEPADADQVVATMKLVVVHADGPATFAVVGLEWEDLEDEDIAFVDCLLGAEVEWPSKANNLPQLQPEARWLRLPTTNTDDEGRVGGVMGSCLHWDNLIDALDLDSSDEVKVCYGITMRPVARPDCGSDIELGFMIKKTLVFMFGQVDAKASKPV